MPPEPSWSCRETQSNSSVQFEFRKSRKSIAVSDRSTFRGCNIRTRRGAARSRADSEPYRLSKTGTRHRGSLQHIAADIGSCGDHDWLERQPDETLDCFSGSGGCISQHKLANSSSCADAAIAGLQSESATRVSGLPFRLFDHNSKARHCPSADEREAPLRWVRYPSRAAPA